MKLDEIFSNSNMSENEVDKLIYSRDASGIKNGDCLGVVWPRTKEELHKLLAYAKRNDVTLVPRGAGTSMHGQCVANGSLVVDMSKMNKILEIGDDYVIVQAGVVLDDLNNIETRSNLALADTYAGLCIANAGVTLPHGVGMAIGGMYPHIAHGETLAILYPAFSRFTWKSAISEFAALGRAFNSSLMDEPEELAAEKSCEEIDAFLKKIGMWMSLKDKGMPENEIPLLAEAGMVLPDYQNNPRIATKEEMLEIVRQSYDY